MSEQPPRFLPPVPDEPAAEPAATGRRPEPQAPQPEPARPVFTRSPHAGPSFAGRPLASIWQRFGAVVIDFLLAVALSIPLVLAIVGTDTFEDAGGSPFAVGSDGDGLVISVITAATFLLVSATMLRWDGRTPGKRALGIRVVCVDGRPFDAQAYLIRQGLIQAVAGTLVPLFSVIDYGAALFDEQRRTLHDRAAGTRVVVDDGR